MTAPVNSSWIESILGGAVPAEGERAVRQGRILLRDGMILRDDALVVRDQAQTRDAFAFKWDKRDTYASDAMRGAMRQWLADRYGDLIGALKAHGGNPIVLDAGCGAGFSGSLLFSEHLNRLRYVGA